MLDRGVDGELHRGRYLQGEREPGWERELRAAAQAQQSFAVAKGDQTIVFTSTAPSGAKVGGSTYEVAATGGGSGNPVTFTIDPSASSVCSIAGSTV